MIQVQAIKTHLEAIGTALKTIKLRVPPYQRSYSWEREHVEAFLNDIKEAISSNDKEYFLGSIVVTGTDAIRYDVIDGQQRLATISLIISAIKDVFSESGDPESASSIEVEYIANTDRRTKERQSRLTLNEVDDEIYQNLITSIPGFKASSPLRKSQQRLCDAAKMIYSYFKGAYEKEADPEDYLHTWLDYIEKNLKIIIVTAPDEANAFVIFETLNDRGLELAISDLLKNYLFNKSGDKIEDVKERWTTMIATLETASEEQLVVTYLRHFAVSQFGPVREKDLYWTLKKNISSKRSAISFATNLASCAKKYAAMLNHEHEYWDNFSDSSREHILALNTLGMVQVRPLLLAILSRFEKKNIVEAIKLLVSIVVRFQVVGGGGAGTLERVYGVTAQDVFSEIIVNASDISKRIINIPTDSAFKESFAHASFSKQALARFYLRQLEDQNTKHQSETIPSYDVKRVNLEHILPQTPSKEWVKSWTADEAKAYYKRLGNLALMNTKANSSFGNEGFSTKIPVFKASSFTLTQEVASEVNWDKAAIDKRQLRLAELAVKLWAI